MGKMKNGKGALSTLTLKEREADDPMRLHGKVMDTLQQLFSKHNVAFDSKKRKMMDSVIESILIIPSGTVSAIPMAPGLGKSTLIRALLEVFSTEFRLDTPIAKRLGGVIVVVEKTAEAEELAAVCNDRDPDAPTAYVLSSPNDYNLGQGRCVNGRASKFGECPGKQCPDRNQCILLPRKDNIEKAPILIMLHARYDFFMENMATFGTWRRNGEERKRTLLLVDELPQLVEEQQVGIKEIADILIKVDSIKPSHEWNNYRCKLFLFYKLFWSVGHPFLNILGKIQTFPKYSGSFSRTSLDEVGFNPSNLIELNKEIIDYASYDLSCGTVPALMGDTAYYVESQSTKLYFPRLRRLDGENQPATFLFSGTAAQSPTIVGNPNISILPYNEKPSYARLTIHIQRGDDFGISKTAFANAENLEGAVCWIESLMPDLIERHRKILVVTYKKYSETFWERLGKYRDYLIPYIDGEGKAKEQLPYFGGLNGSNRYAEATCVLCVGLNRYDPATYLCNAIATDFSGECEKEMAAFMEETKPDHDLVQLPCVMRNQNLCLGIDFIQLVFRSALRRHGETRAIDAYLIQPPTEMVDIVQQYFGDCKLEEMPPMPPCCKQAAVSAHKYNGKNTHAGTLLQYLQAWDGKPISPKDIRNDTGLSDGQFKEAKKNEAVRRYFADNIRTEGSGRNTIYRKKLEIIPTEPPAA